MMDIFCQPFEVFFEALDGFYTIVHLKTLRHHELLTYQM